VSTNHFLHQSLSNDKIATASMEYGQLLPEVADPLANKVLRNDSKIGYFWVKSLQDHSRDDVLRRAGLAGLGPS
jgi:hypothetical protein